MKKILTAILAISMIASLASVFSFADVDKTASDAGQHEAITISADEVTVKANESEAVVTVTVSGIDPQIGIAAIIAAFKVEGAEIKSAVAGDLPGDNVVFAKVGDQCVAYWADGTGVKTESVVFAKLTVTIPATAKAGDELAVKVFVAQDPDMYLSAEDDAAGERISYGAKAADGKITVAGADFIPGDVNGDGKINAKDVTAIMRHIIGKTPEGFNLEAADFNGDGKINAKDVTGVMKRIVSGK